MVASLDIIIAGGSISGLVCGIVLKHAGHNVCIIEKEQDQRLSHMAGLGLGLDAQEFLRRHDRISTEFTIESTRVRVFKQSDGTSSEITNRALLTSWDAVYYRLRALFDGFISPKYPVPPQAKDSDGVGKFQSLRQMIDVRFEQESRKMVAAIKNLETGQVYEKRADYVIGADGSNSALRQKYLPASQHRYAGYIGLRGTVPETELTPATKATFEHNITQVKMEKHHCVIYTIPGPDGSVQPGERQVNFLWYFSQTPNDLSRTMADNVTGQQRHNTVPAGRVQQDVWDGFVKFAEAVPFPSPSLELIHKIRFPFIQAILEHCAPQAAFENGKVLLVGNAVALFRPHNAFSTSQAAFHAFETERLIQGQISLSRWEERVLRFSWIHWSQAALYGIEDQNGMLVALPAWIRYHLICGIDRIKAWWYGEEPLHRLIGTTVDLKYKPE